MKRIHWSYCQYGEYDTYTCTLAVPAAQAKFRRLTKSMRQSDDFCFFVELGLRHLGDGEFEAIFTSWRAKDRDKLIIPPVRIKLRNWN